MKISKQIFALWLILLFPFLLISCFYFYKKENNTIEKANKLVNSNVGKKFPFEYLVDTGGNKISLASLTTDLTIIDLWFEQCPECIKEMIQFKELLKDNEKKISVLSLSIDFPIPWKKLCSTSIPPFNFLSSNLINWKHGNIQPPDSFEHAGKYIEVKLKSNHYPAYFVIDRNGIIKETPVSAVNYIKTHINKQSEYLLYIKKTLQSKAVVLNIFLLTIFYNGLFFLFYLITIGIKPLLLSLHRSNT
jgi:peroxiredoxin